MEFTKNIGVFSLQVVLSVSRELAIPDFEKIDFFPVFHLIRPETKFPILFPELAAASLTFKKHFLETLSDPVEPDFVGERL